MARDGKNFEMVNEKAGTWLSMDGNSDMICSEDKSVEISISSQWSNIYPRELRGSTVTIKEDFGANILQLNIATSDKRYPLSAKMTRNGGKEVDMEIDPESILPRLKELIEAHRPKRPAYLDDPDYVPY